MKEYYLSHRLIKFFPKHSGRVKATRKRYSHMYSSEDRKNGHLPFRVASDFWPAFFYTELMNHRKNYLCGIDVIHRGIWRNKCSKGEY